MDTSILGPLAALMSSVTWLIGSASYASLARSYDPMAVNVARAQVAIPIYLLACIWQWDVLAPLLANEGTFLFSRALWLIGSIIASYVLGDALFFRGAVLAGLPTTQALASTFPCWSAAAAWLLAGETLLVHQTFGLFLAVAGCILVMLVGNRKAKSPGSAATQQDDLPPKAAAPAHPRFALGVMLALATSVFWAFNSFAVNMGGKNFPAAPANLLRLVAAWILCRLLLQLRRVEPQKARLSRADFRRYFPAILIEATAGTFFYMYGLTHSNIAVGTTLSSLAPIFSVPVAVLLGWERFSMLKLLGIILGTVGIIFLVSN